jgi:hypothetical protein
MSTKSRRIVNGYVLLYRPDHFNCLPGENWEGYVYEHRYEMEKELGRALTSNELVHHLDCDKSNNDLSNLIVVSRADHMKIHYWIDKGAAVYESCGENGVNSKNAKSTNGKRCSVCEGSLSKYQKRTCSVTCHNEYMARHCRKVERPPYSQLMLDTENFSMVKIGEKYGVTDNAVRKWIKSYESDMPTLSQVGDTSLKGAETSGEVQPS